MNTSSGVERVHSDRFLMLRGHPLLRELPEETIERLVSISVTRRMGNGEALFFKGDEGDALYGVVAGMVRIVTSAVSGREIILSLMQPGDVFGEIALLDGGPRTADAVAMGKTELLMIRRRDFVALIEREPAMAIHLLRILASRLRSTSARIEDIAFLPLEARLAKQLLALSHDASSDGLVRISQADLGQLLGLSRESINKQLQEWRREGWIELGRGRVIIQDPAALASVVAHGEDSE